MSSLLKKLTDSAGDINLGETQEVELKGRAHGPYEWRPKPWISQLHPSNRDSIGPAFCPRNTWRASWTGPSIESEFEIGGCSTKYKSIKTKLGERRNTKEEHNGE